MDKSKLQYIKLRLHDHSSITLPQEVLNDLEITVHRDMTMDSEGVMESNHEAVSIKMTIDSILDQQYANQGLFRSIIDTDHIAAIIMRYDSGYVATYPIQTNKQLIFKTQNDDLRIIIGY